MATKTSGFTDEYLSTATRGSLGTRFLAEVVTASLTLHAHRAEARERALRTKQGTTLSLQQYMQRAFRDAERGILQRQQDRPPPEGGDTDSETDGDGWETDSDGLQSEGGYSDFSLLGPRPRRPGRVSWVERGAPHTPGVQVATPPGSTPSPAAEGLPEPDRTGPDRVVPQVPPPSSRRAGGERAAGTGKGGEGGEERARPA